MPVTSPWPSLVPYPRHHLSDLLCDTAQQQPDAIALIGPDERTYSFARVWQASQSMARLLQDHGVARGETVAIFSPNCPEYVPAFHGSLIAGAVVTTINPLYREREVLHQLNDARAVAIFTTRALTPMVDGVRREVPRLRRVYIVEDIWEMAAGVSAEPQRVQIDPEQDMAVLPYSSGTTGLPKGVMLSHFNLVSDIGQRRASGIAQPGLVLLDFLPFYHIFGMMVLMNMGLATGSLQIVLPRFDPELVLHFVAKYRVTDLYVVPPALLNLVYFAEAHGYDTSSLRLIESGAAPLAPEVAERAQQLFGCPVLQGYGLTETSPTTNVNPLDRIKLSSVGAPLPDTTEKIVDLETGRELPVGEVGELLVQGPQVMLGYWDQPQATAEAFAPGRFLRTGDICRFDHDGYLYVLDRRKEMIKHKGYQVAPAELEAVLLEHPAVDDVAVIPKPDFASGEVPKAFVVLRMDCPASKDDIIEFVAERVAPYKKVREVEFVEEVPKTASGKILRRELIERERAKAQERL